MGEVASDGAAGGDAATVAPAAKVEKEEKVTDKSPVKLPEPAGESSAKTEEEKEEKKVEVATKKEEVATKANEASDDGLDLAALAASLGLSMGKGLEHNNSKGKSSKATRGGDYCYDPRGAPSKSSYYDDCDEGFDDLY